MFLFIFEDKHGLVYEPHGIESCYWSTTLEGSDMLKAAGWKPYEMHRVSCHLHGVLIELGHLVSKGDPRKEVRASVRASGLDFDGRSP